MTQQPTVSSQVPAVNALLLKGEPTNISVDTYSHYTGYKPQYIIDAMNEVFQPGNWGFEELESTLEGGLAIAKVRVWLKGVDFQPAAWGQARVTKGDLGDARKGAQTDGLKKALSYFSIGNRAYQGLLKAPEEVQDATGANIAPAKGNGRVVPIRPTQEELSHGITEQQIASIRNLCNLMGKPEPEGVSDLGYDAAKQEIARLSQEYRQSRNKAASRGSGSSRTKTNV
jgi:Rad52/22 family double-strand break repair protein